MAFSKNRNQLFNWGPIFGIEAMKNELYDDLVRKQLDYWIAVNTFVVTRGRDLFANDFHILRYEDLCMTPQHTIDSLLSFLHITPESDQLQRIYEIPKKQPSFARQRLHDLSIFSRQQLNKVHALEELCNL